MYAAFARLVGARLDEVELPLEEYATFGSFFARRLRDDARAIDAAAGVVVSPCDGVIAAAGVADGGRMIQAKGHDYAVADLVVDHDLAARVDGGAYVTIYLSPRDYHRVHAPCDAELLGYDYVPGRLFPVSRGWAARVPELFSRNERLVLHLRSELGAIALVMVGAVGVGNMALAVDDVETRRFRPGKVIERVRYAAPKPLARGAELGCFHLGSTVVLLFARGRAALIDASEGDPVRLGEPLAARIGVRREDASA
jgi:phosphatidylserine decarboxylase